jgi:alpha-beta hydrolase superfamily lysophospholipase
MGDATRIKNIMIKSEYSIIRLLIFLGFVYLLVVGVAFFLSEKMMFPYKESSYGQDVANLKFIKNEDGNTVATRFWKSELNSHLILYFHGNGEDVGELDSFAEQMNSLGVSVLTFDYRGYGLSSGKASESNVNSDALLVLDMARELGYENDKILLWGRSIGSGGAVHLATSSEFAGLILVSPLKSIYTVITGFSIIPFDRFDSYSKLDQFDFPLYIVHGTEDQVIASSHGVQMFESYRGKKCISLIDGAGHNNLWSHGFSDYFPLIIDFVSKEDVECETSY